jgi:hypothetical protein
MLFSGNYSFTGINMQGSAVSMYNKFFLRQTATVVEKLFRNNQGRIPQKTGAEGID